LNTVTAVSNNAVNARSLEAVWDFLGENGQTFSNVTAGISSIVTALAVIIGGIWAYRKFIRGRTFKPRVSVDMCAQWHFLAGVGHVLRVRIRVTNIGASKLALTSRGTGLTVGFPAAMQTSQAHRHTDEWWADIRWEKLPLLEGGDQARTFAILKGHEWIEPGETVSDDLLLNIGRDPTIARLEVKLLWQLSRWWWKDKATMFVARQIIPSASVIVDNR
jgi:hypothetical protein